MREMWLSLQKGNNFLFDNCYHQLSVTTIFLHLIEVVDGVGKPLPPMLFLHIPLGGACSSVRGYSIREIGAFIFCFANLPTLDYFFNVARNIFTAIRELKTASDGHNMTSISEIGSRLLRVGFKMFLGVTASVSNWDTEGTCCSLILEDNPLVDFVELPDTCQGLYYCNILSGVVRGALEMVSMKTEVTWVRDMLRGDDAFELQVKLLKQVPEEYPYKDDE
ncbi:putative transport protein particle (TRAPP) component [Helianthus anomalus]